MPILISEFLWSLGQNVESAVYGHLGTSSLAAYTLTGQMCIRDSLPAHPPPRFAVQDPRLLLFYLHQAHR